MYYYLPQVDMKKNFLAHVVLLYNNDDGFKLAVVQKK